MTHRFDIQLLETFDDDFGWDAQEVRDLIQTTPVLYDVNGQPVGYDAGQLFGHEGAHLGRF
jgi:hypothetical protein